MILTEIVFYTTIIIALFLIFLKKKNADKLLLPFVIMSCISIIFCAMVTYNYIMDESKIYKIIEERDLIILNLKSGSLNAMYDAIEFNDEVYKLKKNATNSIYGNLIGTKSILVIDDISIDEGVK